MLLAMVIISGLFMVMSLLAAGFKANGPGSDSTVVSTFVQAIAWAFFFVVNLIALVK